MYFPDGFMDGVWTEIEMNVQDAVNILKDDGNFRFVPQLEKNIKGLEGEKYSLNSLNTED